MLYVPSLFSENLMDDWMDDFESEFFGRKNPLYGKHAKNMMKTDVKETENGYEVAVDLPGFKKDEISLELKDGYLTITASKGLDKDEEDKKGRMIRQERYAGAMSRSYYVVDHITEKDVKVKFENGVLMLDIPKKEEKPQEPERKLITIE